MSFILILVFLLSCTSSVLSTQVTKDDEFVLLKLKKQLHNPDILSSWVKGFNFCNLPFLTTSPAVNIMCDVNNRVFNLQMKNLDIHAPFPNAICNFTALGILEINHVPGLHGSIPSCITKLPNLQSITVVETSLSGYVPNFFANVNIEVINLSSNRLSGTIPSSLSTLQNLFYLDLSSNCLTGSIPPGIFPQNVSHYPGYYPKLLLSNNNLIGEIPNSYGSVDFMAINVANNQLYGDASFLFGFNKNAESIILANNHFAFDFSYVQMPWPIYILDISHNEIYGNVPWSFTIAFELWQPNLSFNKLCGELPQGGNMERFNATVFANNTCLCGYPLSPCFNSAPAPAPATAPN